MYKAIFLDLDGTLLDDKKNISQENLEAIKYAIEKGVYVCIASGRSIESTKKYWTKAGASRYMIYSNGAGILDCQENENISVLTIEKDITLKLFNYAVKNGICVRLDTPYGRYITDMLYNVSNTEMELTEEIEKFLNENKIVQLSFVHVAKEKIDDLVEFFNNTINHELKIEDLFTTGLNNEFFAMNVVNTSVSKGNAIAGLCKFLKIDLKDVIAMGDGLNDISMLSTVGLGVAMGNATSEVKLAAKEITCTNNENGVAKIIMCNL